MLTCGCSVRRSPSYLIALHLDVKSSLHIFLLTVNFVQICNVWPTRTDATDDEHLTEDVDSRCIMPPVGHRIPHGPPPKGTINHQYCRKTVSFKSFYVHVWKCNSWTNLFDRQCKKRNLYKNNKIRNWKIVNYFLLIIFCG